MNYNTKRAVIATVKIGHIEFEGLMLPDGGFAIGMSQLAILDLVPPGRSLKQLKAFLGFDIECIQLKSDLNAKAINVIKLDQMEQILVSLIAKGHVPAIEFWNRAYPDKTVAMPRKKKANRSKSWIYVFEANNAIKVGFSTNVQQRMETLSRWPGELDLILKIKGELVVCQGDNDV